MALIEVRDVYKRLGNKPVLRGVNLAVPEGSIVALLGANGAGKTTAFNVITGVYPPTSGHVTLDGKRIDGRSPVEINRAGIARTFQNIRLFQNLTVLDNVLLPCRFSGRRRGRAMAAGESLRAEAVRLLEHLGMDAALRAREATKLSVGQQQRVAAARALIGRPELIIADEPTGNLDPQSSEEIIKLLKELVGTGRSVLFATHDMLLYNKFRSRTLLFENGQVVERL